MKNAAQTTAILGESTRVETTVAIELAASCRPLRKSKIRAIAIRAASSKSESGIAESPRSRSDVLDDDALNLVSDVIKAVHTILQMFVDLAAADELECIPAFGLLVEQL